MSERKVRADVAWRAALVGLALLTSATPATAQERGRGGLRPFASPGVVIGADSARDTLARLKGQAAADRASAADGAIVFAPDRRAARDWLKQTAAAGPVIRHQPTDVWVSCDASYAVTRGAWRPDGAADGTAGAAGVYVTVWQRQPKANAYRWILDLRRAGPIASDPLDMIAGNVAPCPAAEAHGAHGAPGPARGGKPRLLQPDIDPAGGASDDGSLRWKASLDAAGAGGFVAQAGSREVMRVALAAER